MILNANGPSGVDLLKTEQLFEKPGQSTAILSSTIYWVVDEINLGCVGSIERVFKIWVCKVVNIDRITTM